MSVKLAGITHFLKDFSKLIDKPKKGYSSLPKDIGEFLTSLTTPDIIRQIPETLLIKDNVVVKKCRLRNSGLNLSDKNGFRLIFLYLFDTDQIVFLTIYPKRGPYASEDLAVNGLTQLLEQYMHQKDELINFECETSLKHVP